MSKASLMNLKKATLEDFFGWINERHWMYVRRFEEHLSKPWTKDSILRTYKFTNVFRQLDTGTIALNKMLGKWHKSMVPFEEMDVEDAVDILFNIVWYRLFNRAEHAVDVGFQKAVDHQIVKNVLQAKKDDGEKIFTSAHMVCSPPDAIKFGKLYAAMVGPIGLTEEIIDGISFGERLISFMYHNQTMEAVTNKLCEIPMVGGFVAYEIACDLRFTPLLAKAPDVVTWANLGPGAKRGLVRLGLQPCSDSMFQLYEMAVAEEMIGHHVAAHLTMNEEYPFNDGWPPFELREIEHSLCEFDKYWRVKSGEGRPRMRYNG